MKNWLYILPEAHKAQASERGLTGHSLNSYKEWIERVESCSHHIKCNADRYAADLMHAYMGDWTPQEIARTIINSED
mgnify:CR=1 FL=1